MKPIVLFALVILLVILMVIMFILTQRNKLRLKDTDEMNTPVKKEVKQKKEKEAKPPKEKKGKEAKEKKVKAEQVRGQTDNFAAMFADEEMPDTGFTEYATTILTEEELLVGEKKARNVIFETGFASRSGELVEKEVTGTGVLSDDYRTELLEEMEKGARYQTIEEGTTLLGDGFFGEEIETAPAAITEVPMMRDEDMPPIKKAEKTPEVKAAAAEYIDEATEPLEEATDLLEEGTDVLEEETGLLSDSTMQFEDVSDTLLEALNLAKLAGFAVDDEEEVMKPKAVTPPKLPEVEVVPEKKKEENITEAKPAARMTTKAIQSLINPSEVKEDKAETKEAVMEETTDSTSGMLVGKNVKGFTYEEGTENRIYVGCTLDKATFTEGELVGAKFISCKVENSGFLGAELDDALIEDTVFVNCRFKFATLKKAKLFKASFIDCNFEKADFEEAYMDGCLFENCMTDKMTSFENVVVKNVKVTPEESIHFE